jgi:hypothetical protein
VLLPASTSAVLVGAASGASTAGVYGAPAIQAAILPVPSTCTVSNLSVTVFGAQNTSTASIDVGTSTAAQAEAGEITDTSLQCKVTANNGSPVSCTSTSSYSDSPGNYFSIVVFGFSSGPDFENARVTTNFTCE